MTYSFVEDETLPQPSIAKKIVGETLEIPKQLVRQGVNVFSSIAGVPGEVSKLVNDLVAAPISSAITGQKAVPYEETPFSVVFPTSEQLRKGAEKIGPGFLKPRNEIEKFADNVVSDAASLAFGGGVNRLKKAAGVSLLANSVGEGVDSFFGKESSAGQKAKTGIFVLASLFDKKKITELKDSLFKKARDNLPAEAKVASSELKDNLKKLDAQIKKGGRAPFKTKALDLIEDIKKKISPATSEIPVDELEAFKINLNNSRSALYTDVNLDKQGRRMAKSYLDSLAKVVDSSLEKYGKTNPEWFKFYNQGKEVHGAIAEAKRASEFMKKFARSHPHSSAAALGAALFKPFISIPSGAAGVGALKGYEQFKMLQRSPILRKHYAEIIKNSLKEDSAALMKSLNNFSEAEKKENKKNSKGFTLLD